MKTSVKPTHCAPSCPPDGKVGRTTLLLMRHGQILQQPAGPDGSRRYVGNTDIPLDDTGRAQAREAARLFTGLPVRVAVSSDLSRSVETAQLALAGLGTVAPELVQQPALREISLGQWQGLYPAQVRQRYPGCWEARGADLAGYRPPEGENFEDVAARALPALVDIARQLHAAGDPDSDKGEDRTALVVAHAGVNLALLCRLMDLPLASALAMPQDYGCLNVLVWNHEWQHLAVRAVNLLPAALGPGWARVYDIIG
jgi:probable phosphoglycerate mutase